MYGKQLLHKDLSNGGTVEEAERKIIWKLPLKLGTTTKGMVLLFLNKARTLFSLFLTLFLFLS